MRVDKEFVLREIAGGILKADHEDRDKTECLEKEIERFPSVYIEGAAGCGKTTMMRMKICKSSGKS